MSKIAAARDVESADQPRTVRATPPPARSADTGTTYKEAAVKQPNAEHVHAQPIHRRP